MAGRAVDVLRRLAVALIACFVCVHAVTAGPLPRSVLVLDQSIPYTAYFSKLFAAFQATLKAGSNAPITIYSERLEYSHFNGPDYDRLLHTFITEKYRERPIGIILAVGLDALQFAVNLRTDLGPATPIVFASIDDNSAAQMKLPPDVTGTTLRASLRDVVTSAKALVPRFKRLAVVGDPLEQQTYRRHYRRELQTLAGEFEVIDLTGLPMTELRRRLSSLPDDAAIFYTTLSVDGAGTRYDPNDALALLSEVANRPIVIDQETRLGYGGAGGYLLLSTPIGEETGRLALRVLDGESASGIPVKPGDFVKPVFDGRELKRWKVSESRLPAGSEVLFRQAGAWEQYRTQILFAFAMLLLQSVIISGLLIERHRRRAAEVTSRNRQLENIRLNRVVTVEATSRSIAHELKQPLTAIQFNTLAAQHLLEAPQLDILQLKEILADILSADQRADDIITHLRQLLKRKPEIEFSEFDLNDTVRSALSIIGTEAVHRRVDLEFHLLQGRAVVRADPIHLQQVVLNLAMNAMEAMDGCAPDRRPLALRTALIGSSEVMVSVMDGGPGIPEERLQDIFEPFVTTKEVGTGLGLSIARTIIETHQGKIWAENRAGGGAIFRFVLPLANAQAAAASP